MLSSTVNSYQLPQPTIEKDESWAEFVPYKRNAQQRALVKMEKIPISWQLNRKCGTWFPWKVGGAHYQLCFFSKIQCKVASTRSTQIPRWCSSSIQAKALTLSRGGDKPWACWAEDRAKAFISTEHHPTTTTHWSKLRVCPTPASTFWFLGCLSNGNEVVMTFHLQQTRFGRLRQWIATAPRLHPFIPNSEDDGLHRDSLVLLFSRVFL